MFFRGAFSLCRAKFTAKVSEVHCDDLMFGLGTNLTRTQRPCSSLERQAWEVCSLSVCSCWPVLLMELREAGKSPWDVI